MLHMRNGEISVPFLSESEIKKSAFEEEKQADKQQFKEQDVKELIDMGFTREKVVEALSICDGNKEHAATYLMQGESPKPK